MKSNCFARIALIATIVGAAPAALVAQSGGSPSFQPPSITTRELNFGVTHFKGGVAALLFQWREGISPRLQFSLDAGLADAEARTSDNQVIVGGALAYELAKESPDVPLDFLLTGGLYLGAGNYGVLRVPVGVSVGHTFLLEGNLSITPYVHPRVALESCKGCSTLAVDFDVGGNLQISRILALRVSGVFGSSEVAGHDGFGISLAWTPPGLRRNP
ncbi:MAG: hypothetical protein ABI877_13190 [Gemmatimonadaceae bacterium]